MYYIFGDCTLDTQRYEFTRAGESISLRRKVFELLAYLLAQRDRVVSKDELLEHLWPEQYSGDAVLNSCLMAVRKAIGDDGQAQRCIHTQRGRGYRFVAPVEVQERPPGALRPACEPRLLGAPEPAPALPPLPAAPVPTQEYKQVTVFCCAVAEASALAAQLGPEATHHVMQVFFDLVQEVLQRYEGTLTQFERGGCVAVFGAPVAQEDHARRAVLAACALRQRLREDHAWRAPAPGTVLAVGIGLHTGPVVVGPLADDPQPRYTVAGETTYLATQLQQLATPGTLLISAATYRLVQAEVQAEVWDASGRTAPQFPVPVYAVQGLSQGHAGGPEHSRRPLSRFVGRERELAILHERLAQAESGQGQVVSIVGNPGMGKSRLLYEFRRSLIERPVTYRAGRCFSYGSTTPYLPLQALVRHSCGLADTDPPEAMAARVHACLQQADIAPEEGAPLLLQLLGVSTASAQLPQYSPPARKARTFALLHRLFLAHSQCRPLVLAVEDLHWIDATSEEYLASLVEQFAGGRLLLVVTYRSGYRPPWLERSTATQLALPRLLPQESLQVVQSVTQAAPLDADLVQKILAKAAGNPFFLEELAQNSLESGGHAAALVIPETIQAVLAARIDRLTPTEKRLLQTAAVIGPAVSVPLLQVLTALPEDTLQRSLRHLQTAELLYEARLLPECVYTFKHALIQEVAYQSLLRRTRQQLHAHIAHVLETQFPEVAATQPAQLAQHYTAGGRIAPAVAAWQQAGRLALERSAYVEALAHLTQGMDLLKGLPDTEARTQQELALLVALGPVLFAVKGWVSPELARLYTRARTLCCHAEDAQLFPVLHGLWQVHSDRGEQGPAQELATEFLHLAQRLRNSALEVVGDLMVGATLYRRGEFSAALEYLTHGTRLYDPQQHQALSALYMADPGGACHCFAAHVLWLLGYPDRAIQQCQAALTLAQHPPHPLSLARAQYFRTVLCHFRREAPQAEEWADIAIAHAQAQGFPSWTSQTTMLRGWARAMRGDCQAGLAEISTGVSMFQTAEGVLPLPYPLSLLAEALYANGQIAEALQVLAKVLTLMEQGGICWWKAEIYRLTGECLWRQEVPDPTGAEQQLQQALDLARQQQARSLELRAAMSLSRLWQSQGKRTAARQVLAEVYDWFTEGFDTADLQEARALLKVLGV